MNEKMSKTIKYYTGYLCGMIDVLTLVKDVFGASDVSHLLKEVITDVAREAYLLSQEEKK